MVQMAHTKNLIRDYIIGEIAFWSRSFDAQFSDIQVTSEKYFLSNSHWNTYLGVNDM